MSTTSPQLSPTNYVWKITYRRPDDGNATSFKDYEEYVVAPHIDGVIDHIAPERVDQSVEVTRCVPVLPLRAKTKEGGVECGAQLATTERLEQVAREAARTALDEVWNAPLPMIVGNLEDIKPFKPLE